MKHEMITKPVIIKLLDGTVIGEREIATTKHGTAWLFQNGKNYKLEEITGVKNYFVIVSETPIPGYDLIETPTT